MKHVMTLEACVMGITITTQTSHFFSGLDTLLSGHLSLSLVRKNVSESQFVAAQAKGYMPVFPSLPQVFEFPVSYFVESSYLYILVDIPIVPVYDLLYKALPIFSDGHLLQLSGSTDFIAISEDKSRFIEVSLPQ